MEDFWYHNKSVSAPISLSQCGYEYYHPNSSIRNYIVQQTYRTRYFLFFQGQKVKYYTDKKEPWTLIWLGIQGDKTSEFLKETTLLNTHTVSLTKNINKKHTIENSM